MSLSAANNRMHQKQTKSSSFHVHVTGQIESATKLFSHGMQRLYCRYVLSYGNDWTIIHGMTSGITQMASSKDCKTIWNFPIELAFRSTNAYGWPRISIAVYGLDFFGRDVVRGYGSVLVPTSPGRHTLTLEIYRPISGNICHQFLNWLKGTLPEYYETAFTARGEGRVVTRVRSEGEVQIVLNASIKGMTKSGFSNANMNKIGWNLKSSRQIQL